MPGRVASLSISGAPDSGKVYAGQSIQLSAVAYDADHRALSDVTITWTSSDTTKATVRPFGIVFTRAEGVVTITAACEGVQAATQLTISLVPVASVRVTPTSAAAVMGRPVRLTAAALDANGLPLPGRPVTWASSNPAIATVDHTGEITGIAPGTVTITATSQQQAGTADLVVIARPLADWSSATEWLTYQGNASHTGYVPATVDPVVFRPLWTTTIAPSTPISPVPLNQVTTGDGLVAVSTNTNYGTQLLTVLDAGTGLVRWSYNFGAIASVSAPAYTDGKLYVQTGGHADSYLWAFDASTGGLAFRTPYANQFALYLTPTVDASGVYVGGGEYGGMYAFNTSDGSQRWFVELPQIAGFTPTVRDGMAYVYAGALTAVDAASGAAAYEIPDHGACACLGPYNIAVFGASNNLLVIDAGRVTSFDLVGRRINWQLTDAFVGNVAVANGVVYAINYGWVEARRESDGVLSWKWEPPEGKSALPTLLVTKNLLFVSTETRTYALDLSAHTQVWSHPETGKLALSRDGVLFIAQGNGKLTAIAVK